MLFTTVDPITPPQVLALIGALQSVDPRAEIRIDATGRQARIEGAFTPQQVATAIFPTGPTGVVTRIQHARGTDPVAEIVAG